MANTKLCIVTSSGTLPILGGINGPLQNPSELSIKDIILLVNSGFVVYEVNPRRRSEKVRLTTRNINSTNFNTTTKVEKKVATKKVEPFTLKDISVTATSSNASKLNLSSGTDSIVKITKPDFF